MNDQLLDTPIQQEVTPREIRKLVEYAVSLLGNAGLTTGTVAQKIIDKGHSQDTAFKVIELALAEIKEANKGKAKRDVIVGGIFFVLGTVMTFANIGFIFWGAIVFGAVQCIRGIINLSNSNN